CGARHPNEVQCVEKGAVRVKQSFGRRVMLQGCDNLMWCQAPEWGAVGRKGREPREAVVWPASRVTGM
ncbi:hypothetical protein, partial [Thalassobacillus sp. C254]|uniref:hypothetical protein n=1 Tax=Thalassobacillus sp. C254 TaxID=1225341 RepID=UPI0006D19AAC